MFQFTGNVLTGFNISAITKDGLSLIKKGSITISIQFKTALQEAVNVIVYTVDQQLMTIDQRGNVEISK